MFLCRKKGQITIFSLIILLAMLILAGVLVDISRIGAGRAIVKRAAETSAKSLLAEYGSTLKDRYGIFAMPMKDSDSLNDQFLEDLTCNLSIPGEDAEPEERADLFGFRVERIRVTPIFNLSENQVTKQQILEYMKYRAPTELVEGFVGKLKAMKDLGKMSEAYKKKVGIDKLLGRMDKSQQKLKKSVDGSGNASEKFINGFNAGGSWESAYNQYNSLAEQLSSISSSLSSMDNDISALEELLEQQESAVDSSGEEADDNSAVNSENSGEGGSAGDISTSNSSNTGDSASNNDSDDAADETKKQIEALKEERSALQDSYSDIGSQAGNVWNELRNSLTGDYKNANGNAVNEIQKIIEKGKQAQQAISELETYLGDNFGRESGEFSEQFKEQTQAELDKLKTIILDGKKAEVMLDKVTGNKSLLQNVTDTLDRIETASGNTASSALPSDLLDLIKNYAKVQYEYTKPNKGEKSDDPRKGKAEAVKKFLSEKILKDINYEVEGIRKEDLPSQTKLQTADYGQQDSEFTGEEEFLGASTRGGTSGISYAGDLGNMDKEADLFDEESNFQENALGFLSDIGGMVSEKATGLRDNIYLNEYIMGTFRNSVPETKFGNETVPDKDLHGAVKSKLDTFYESEVEYVLHGNSSQMANNLLTRGEILMVRFGLNTLHVYTDPKKKAMAASIATAVAGWWTGGAGIPVISNLIICGWGMGEAIIDVQDLMDGKAVPIYKMKGDWRLDIGLPSSITPRTDTRLYFNYHDYLRLFLLTMNEEKKLNRVEDLIQFNIGKSKSGFKLSGCSTYVRIEAEVSMKYLFLTMPFVQKELKTGDGRYVFKVLLYEGYQ